MKLALAIRMLAGGNPLGLSVIFDISPSHCKTIFIWVSVNWIIGTNIGKMDIVRYMNDEEEMKKVSQGFARRSNGVLRGAIGSINNWLVKIQRPWVNRDNVKDPASFFQERILCIKCPMHGGRYKESIVGFFFSQRFKSRLNLLQRKFFLQRYLKATTK